MMTDLDLSANRPVLIAGPTASGKSALALRIARTQGGVIVNADSMQVFENWRILTARPSIADEASVPHRLYGHVARDAAYSVGHWLREAAAVLQEGHRPIFVGGTGLYFAALTEGLADIPPTPPRIRAEADAVLHDHGIAALLAAIDPETRARIDTCNPMRVQRAWEVQRATGRGLAEWQAETPAPLLPPDQCSALVLDAPKNWLDVRIAARFGRMMAEGALDEARANLDTWSAGHASSRAIGAAELIAHLKGEITAAAATGAAVIATRQFAKRQRTWFRARMRGWQWISPPGDG